MDKHKTRRGFMKIVGMGVAAAVFTGCNDSVETAKRSNEMSNEELMLWYRQPAAGWTESLPSGNGHDGGTV